MSPLWLIAAPGDPSPDQTWSSLEHKLTRESSLATVSRFSLPAALRCGTLDSLMSLSDDLVRQDGAAAAIVAKIERQLNDLQGKKERPLVNGKTAEHAVLQFTWNIARYPVSASMRDLTEQINTDLANLDAELKKASAEYLVEKTALGQAEKKSTGSLMTRNLAPYVTAEDFHDSEYLVTLLVVVPMGLDTQWMNSYDSLTQFVVPRSSKRVAVEDDPENSLYTVTMFRRVVDNFKSAARESRFIVRDFTFDADAIKQAASSHDAMVVEVDRKWRELIRWCSVQYAEAFQSWLHLKAIRIFVESVLRYGLPVNFMAAVVRPKDKNEKKVRAALDQLYGHLGSGGVGVNMEDMAPGLDASDFYSYVSLDIDLNH